MANRGAAGDLTLATQYLPTAITLDMFLPDMLGWTVLNNLKLDPATRHIPVQIVSVEEERQHGLSHGAFSYLVKPATTEDLEAGVRPHQAVTSRRTRSGCWSSRTTTSSAQSIVELLAARRHRDRRVGTGAEALEALRDAAVRLLCPRSAAAGHDRLRAARADPGRRRRCAICRSSSSPARN